MISPNMLSAPCGGLSSFISQRDKAVERDLHFKAGGISRVKGAFGKFCYC